MLEITLVCAEGTDLPKVSKVESGRFPFSQGCKVLCPPVYILKGRDEVDKMAIFIDFYTLESVTK